MKKKCKNCGTRVIEYPLWKGQEDGIAFTEGNNIGEKFTDFFENKQWQKLKWYNLIIGDWRKLLLMASLLFLTWSYFHDTQVVRDIYENPCDFIEKNQDYCAEQQEGVPTTIIDAYIITIPNMTPENVGQP